MKLFSNTYFLMIFSHRPAELKFSKGLLIPKRGTIYEHVFVRRTLGGMWCTWQSLVKPIDITESTKVKILYNHTPANSKVLVEGSLMKPAYESL